MQKFTLHIVLFMCIIVGCTKVESDFSNNSNTASETIQLLASKQQVYVNDTVNFSVVSSINGNVTNQSTVFVNGTSIQPVGYTFKLEGTYAVYAQKNALTTAVLVINVMKASINPPSIPQADKYVHRVLVEEYSGTWCGNCPQILYGVDLLKLATNKAIVIGIHLFGDDPFITTDGNNLANNRQVFGVPTGHINRVANWITPQYNNVTDVTKQIQPSSNIGLSIQSSIQNNTIQANIGIRFAQTSSSNHKIHCYLVEDNLTHTQRNYYPNLYGGAGSLPNFKYNGVLRNLFSTIQGDDLQNNVIETNKAYTLNISPSLNKAHLKLVAFVTNSNGLVVNVIQSKVGENMPFEKL